MGFIGAIILGALVGWIASMIMKTQMGLLADIAAGVVGGLIGSFIFGSHGIIGQIIVGVIGACILIGVIKLVSGLGKKTSV